MKSKILNPALKQNWKRRWIVYGRLKTQDPVKVAKHGKITADAFTLYTDTYITVHPVKFENNLRTIAKLKDPETY